MLVGSPLVGCVQPRVSGMHYTFCLTELKKKNTSPYSIALPMWSKSQLHGLQVTSGSGHSTLARHLAMWLASSKIGTTGKPFWQKINGVEWAGQWNVVLFHRPSGSLLLSILVLNQDHV